VDEKQTKIKVLTAIYAYVGIKLQFSISSKGEYHSRNFKGSVDVGVVPLSSVIAT
jgi:hypothetical protein